MAELLTGQIDQRDNLSHRDFVNEYVIKNRPVVIRDAFPEWTALQKWTPEFFRREHGHRKIKLAGKEMRMGEYIDAALAATPERPVPYLRECVIREFAPELGEDLQPFVKYALPNWLRGYYFDFLHGLLNRASEPELFIGGPGTRLERRKVDEAGGYAGVDGELIQGYADLHYDPTACPVLLCQVHGEKAWTVFDPIDTPYLYTRGRLSAINNPESPDPERFPLFAKANPIRFVQQPGDAVYIPAGWWHSTRMVSISIAVSSTFANAHHWDGVINDVTGGMPNKVAATLYRAHLKLEGKVKALLGDRVGDDHFRDSVFRKTGRAVKRALRNGIRGTETSAT